MKRFELRFSRKEESDPPAPASATKVDPASTGSEDPSKGGEESNSGLAAIAASVTALVGTIGALTLTGTMGRVQRDDPEAIIWALILVVLAGALWGVASATSGTKFSSFQIWLRVAGILAGFAGFIVALNAAVNTADHEPRPQLSATLSSDHKTLKTTVSASNMSSTRRLAFRVDLLTADQTDQPLYRAYVGPTSDGTVEQTIVTPLPDLAPYSQIGVKAYTGTTSPFCDEYEKVKGDASIGSGTGCILITLPPEANPSPAGTQTKNRK